MKTLKTLITASALTLIVPAAFAYDIYGGFNNSELDSRVGTRYHATSQFQPSDVVVSHDVLYEGHPEAPTNIKGYVWRASPPSGRLTAYDVFMLDNPESGPVRHASVERGAYVDQRTVFADPR